MQPQEVRTNSLVDNKETIWMLFLWRGRGQKYDVMRRETRQGDTVFN